MSGEPTPRYLMPATVAAGIVCSLVFLVIVAGATPPNNDPSTNSHGDTKPVYEETGALRLPDGYRTWVYVGTPITPNDMNGGMAAFPEFHSVYINPWGYHHYLKSGQFPDGTIMVKELTSVGAKSAASGQGYFMGEYLSVEVAVKDSHQFPDEPGSWAYFRFGQHPNLAKSAAAHPTAACNSCHQASAGQDWVFTQYYPVLRAAKAELDRE